MTECNLFRGSKLLSHSAVRNIVDADFVQRLFADLRKHVWNLGSVYVRGGGSLADDGTDDEDGEDNKWTDGCGCSDDAARR